MTILSIAANIATVFSLGRVSSFPGTLGSAVGVLLAIPLLGYSKVYVALLVVLTALAFWSSWIYATYVKRPDPKEVIVDEVVGQLLSIYIMIQFINLDFSVFGCLILLSNFIFFRLFDICKPFPIYYVDKNRRIPGSIVWDDLLAGVFSASTIVLLVCVFNYSGKFSFNLPFIH